ncbi:MAG: 2-oxoacid:acceptor oxidoreductase subunit alpha [Candidatus Freyarchaeota archaeon]|nr:2-oxoacid:acceptor oxidoreductase subunit alpha [Candidatus Jordarchaeia archaeon]MBS7267239.1 2-oxoacid:acceptor oxidoreductase subunit alpha [Candidatus Jordarchaeia archaeon]MBS7278435.1 2-oxoacid:acceptor oxidoreductase subunit alpha [Candidatus Jordarchaeia archaeon]
MAGGPQGSGVDSGTNIFARACCYGGLHVYGKREYHSNIKGLHSYFQVRVSPKETHADVDRVDLLAAFDAETVVRHIWEVSPGGGIIVNVEALETKIDEIKTLTSAFKSEFQKILESKGIKAETLEDLLKAAKKENNVKVYAIPYTDVLREVAEEIHEEKLSRLTRMINVLTLGVSLALVNYDREPVERAIKTIFGEKSKIVQMNIVAFDKSYQYARRAFGDNFGYKLETIPTKEKRIFLQGAQAVALGKLVGGCRFQSYYPITPAADECEYLEENEILEIIGDKNPGSILVMQTEDEIAAINMAIGAALTGARAATSTSGPGFSLMVEGLGWAGNNEVPVVVNYYQRGAPSTGLPTRHGQADLRFAMHASHGEFPRIVLCSGDIQECFYDAARAFNYAERYQMPVIHLIDKALANSSKSYKMFDLNQIRIERGQLLSEKDVGDEEYLRFRFTESGLSPRAPLGAPNIVFWNSGDEHDPLGHINEESTNRTLMLEKRMKKLELADGEIPVEERVNLFGDEEAPNTIVSWGSPKGAVIEALERMIREGYKMNFIQVRMPLPLPKDYLAEKLANAKKKIVVEGNYMAQLAGVIREQTGIDMDYFVLKWNGRPISSDEVYDALKLIMEEKAPRRQVLNRGS